MVERDPCFVHHSLPLALALESAPAKMARPCVYLRDSRPVGPLATSSNDLLFNRPQYGKMTLCNALPVLMLVTNANGMPGRRKSGETKLG